VKLYSKKTNEPKITAALLRLTGFRPSELEVVLSSTSNIVGQRNQTLIIDVDASAPTEDGYIIVHLPDYYDQASQEQEYMVEPRNP